MSNHAVAGPDQSHSRIGRLTPVSSNKARACGLLPRQLSITSAKAAGIADKNTASAANNSGWHVSGFHYPPPLNNPEAVMHIEPIFFISLVKQCTSAEETKQILLNWLNQASLLSFQAQGSAVSDPLIQALNRELNPLLHAVSLLDKNPANTTACQQLFNQISQFYTWLNSLSGKTAVQLLQQWNNSNQVKPPVIEPPIPRDCTPVPHSVTPTNQYRATESAPHTVNDIKFD